MGNGDDWLKARRPGIRKVLTLVFCLSILWATPLLAANWLPFGPDGGDARRIVPDPSDHSHLYLGTETGWIYESHDTGASWRRLARVDKRDDLVLDAIVVDASNPRHLIVGAYKIDQPDGGLYISYDGGKTWASQAEMRGQSIRALGVSPTDPKMLVAGTLRGVFRSTDGGKRWTQISPPDSTEIHNIASVAIDPNDSNVIYAGTWHLPWKTTDGGEHWENIKEGIIEDSDVFSIIVDPKNSKTVYASACSGIYKSENAGTLFHKVQGIPSSARRTRVLMQDPNDLNIVFAGTTEGLFRSNDAGKTWNRTTGPEVIVNDVSIDKTDSHHVLIATNRGGVLSSDDGGDTFHSSNAGFSARQITAIKRDAEHPATLLVGVVNDKEWGGVFRSADGGLSWIQRSEGLQGRDVFALGQAPDGTFIAGTAHGLFRFDHESEAWIKVDAAPSAKGTDAPPPAITIRKPVAVVRNQYAARSATHRASTAKNSKKMAPAQRRAALAPARRKPIGKKTAPHTKLASKSHTGPAKRTAATTIAVASPAPPSGEAPLATDAAAALPTAAAPALGTGNGFDGSVYGLATSGQTVLAITSIGLLSSTDQGVTWALTGPERSAEWRYLASAKDDVVAASLHTVSFSADAGKSWAAVLLPEGLTQVGAVAVEPSGRIWVGGREGIYVSKDAGNTWTTPKNLFVNTVNSIFYDEAAEQMVVTTGGYSSIVFLVKLPQMQVSFADTGWNLRFARPIGDHLVAATLFDGIVVQPRMVATPLEPAAQAVAPPRPVAAVHPAVVQPPPETLDPSGVPVVRVVHLPGSPQ
jgi:photosystem II stability/assembly factor-like uncharacterized protein